MEPSNCGPRQHTAENPPKNAADTDIHFENLQLIAPIVTCLQEGDIVHPDNFAAFGIDDLLIEQVAPHPQHVLVGVVRGKNLVF